jgi:hypothetical protein
MGQSHSNIEEQTRGNDRLLTDEQLRKVRANAFFSSISFALLFFADVELRCQASQRRAKLKRRTQKHWIPKTDQPPCVASESNNHIPTATQDAFNPNPTVLKGCTKNVTNHIK